MPTKVWAVCGDSIMTTVADGTSSQHCLQLVSAEKDIVFRNLSGSGHALGATGNTGFNSIWTTDSFDHLAGMFGQLDGIIVQACTNDFGRNINWGDTVNSFRAICAWARAHGKKVLCLDAIWRAGEDVANSQGNTLNTYRYFLHYVADNEYADVCRYTDRLTYVMGTSAAGPTHYSAAETATGTQLHPNALGHRAIADHIKANLTGWA